MKKFATALLVLFFAAAIANAQVTYSVDAAGLISLDVAAEQAASGLEISASGDLTATAADPFAILLGNTPTKVTLASIPDITLPVGNTPTATSWAGSDGSLALSLGAGGQQSVVAPSGGAVDTPEPTAGLLSVLGGLGLLGFRRRR